MTETVTRDEFEAMRKKYEGLQKSMAELQYIVNGHTESVRLWERLVQMGHVIEHLIVRVMKEYKTKNNGRICRLKHPDHDKLLTHMRNISRRMSTAKRKAHNRYPLIRRRDRGNLYTVQDYTDFGDAVIEKYIEDNPICSWEIQWDWIPEEGYVDPIELHPDMK